eukprot:CAMPEP_0184288440 /NCGR_PEP_ID=MMETSP1049-20130417/963_1 /TAXON_ID=77928 /ORGANISM="Proteomonas sulcata, Strain CCMP704" /LENGTH=103 /DNA_ID=CAMNT_0026594835 /DNA_START=793 /DNA_END=1101 /DNA_ORIENTATION=-
MEHHPDRKGVSTRAGTLQFQEIQEAYTHINKLRRLQQMAHAAAARAAEQAPSTNPAATQSAQEAATKGAQQLAKKPGAVVFTGLALAGLVCAGSYLGYVKYKW